MVCDDLKAGVTRSHRYEPVVNATYLELAALYGVAIIPIRAYKPRDKDKVEAGVQIVERWILLARLRHRRFHSLAELNAAIRELLEALNRRPFKKLEGSRLSLFEEFERPALRPLPRQRYEYADWRVAKVNIDYHIEVDRHYYSVPYQHVGQSCDVRLSARTVEVIRLGRRIASHLRNHLRGRHTTLPEHMPALHRRHLEWTPSRTERWGRDDRTLDCRIGARGARVAAASRTGVSLLPGHPAPEQALWRTAAGGSVPTSSRHSRLQLMRIPT
jgi:transposase